MDRKVGACIVIAFLLRVLAGLNPQLSLDEGYSTYFTQIPLSSIFLFAGLDSNPPLGNALFHLWGLVARDNILLWRLPGILASVLALPIVYTMLRSETSESTALLVIIGKTVSLCDVLFAQQIRVYPFAELLLIISWFALIRFLRGSSPHSGYLWGMCSAAACHFHYVCLLIVIATIGASIIPVYRQAEKRIHFIKAAAMFVVLCTPLSFPLIQQLTVYQSYRWIPSPHAAVLIAAAFQLSGYSFTALTGSLVLIYSLFFIKRSDTGLTTARMYLPTVLPCGTITILFAALAFVGSILGGSFFLPALLLLSSSPILNAHHAWP